MLVLKWLVVGAATVGLLIVLAGQLGLFAGTAPRNLGVREGRLKPPSRTPNSVSSQADLWPGPMADYARIAPLPARGDARATMARLKAVVEAMPGARVIESGDDYLYAQFTTRVLKFVDDVEFWFDPAAQAVQVRSASRLGKGDLGVNRARVEDIRARLAAQPQG